MSSRPRAWVLNLDAEHELELGRTYTPSRRLRSIVARQARALIGSLVAPHDLVLGERDEGARAAGLEGVAWCPTASARKRLEAAGARVPAAPSMRTLREVNARPFAAGVRAPLARGSFEKRVAHDLDEALATLATPAPEGWLVRRAFGAAGRGRRRVAAGAPSPAELAWLRASLRRGPLVIEPWVRVTREYTRSGFVHASGAVVIAPPCFQETTSAGAWTRTERARLDELRRADDARLEEAAAAAGAALAAAGYFGPFGVDAFRHRPPGRPGAPDVLNPLGEINARYTMDWLAAMTRRPD